MRQVFDFHGAIHVGFTVAGDVAQSVLKEQAVRQRRTRKNIPVPSDCFGLFRLVVKDTTFF